MPRAVSLIDCLHGKEALNGSRTEKKIFIPCLGGNTDRGFCLSPCDHLHQSAHPLRLSPADRIPVPGLRSDTNGICPDTFGFQRSFCLQSLCSVHSSIPDSLWSLPLPKIYQRQRRPLQPPGNSCPGASSDRRPAVRGHPKSPFVIITEGKYTATKRRRV